MTHKKDAIIAGYVKLRDQLTVLRAKHSEEQQVFTEKLSKIETWLLKQANAEGVDSFKTPGGTAYKTTKDSVSVADRDVFFAFALEHDQMDLISSAANKTNVKQYLEDVGELPPGIKYEKSYGINVNRPRAKSKKEK